MSVGLEMELAQMKMELKMEIEIEMELELKIEPVMEYLGLQGVVRPNSLLPTLVILVLIHPHPIWNEKTLSQ